MNKNKHTENKPSRIGFWQGYIDWIKGKAHIPLLKGFRRFWILLLLVILIIGPNNLTKNSFLSFTMILTLFGWSFPYYAWQKRLADKKGINVNELPSNFMALVVVLLVWAILSFVLYSIYTQQL